MEISDRYDMEIRHSVQKKYMPRIVDPLIKTMLEGMGGVLITGPKWCGKSWTGLHHSASSLMLGEDIVNRSAELSPNDALSGKYPRLVDEWQDVPELWDVARRRIDFINEKGMYIFTGSSVPGKKVHHSGTGRFARIEMRPMSLFESGDSTGSISLSGLFENPDIDPTPSDIDYKGVIRLICRGGWPGIVNEKDDIAFKISAQYVESIVASDLSDLTGTRKNPSTTEKVLRSLARNVASPVKISTIAKDISNVNEVSEQTVKTYLDSLKEIFMIDEQHGWAASLRSRARIRTAPKLHFIDPSLAAATLGVTPDMLVKDVNTAGLLFESLCYRDLCVYASAIGGRVYHYRDNTDLEVDNIIEMRDGRWGAAEVKLGSFEIDKAADNLIRLANKVEKRPSFLTILTAGTRIAYTRDDGVSVIPIDLLGP